MFKENKCVLEFLGWGMVDIISRIRRGGNIHYFGVLRMYSTDQKFDKSNCQKVNRQSLDSAHLFCLEIFSFANIKYRSSRYTLPKRVEHPTLGLFGKISV